LDELVQASKPKFIKLTAADNDILVVSVDANMRFFWDKGSGMTKLYSGEIFNSTWFVQETPEQILKLIEEA
jgi:hypothetical protein